jgi:hypothetical protein
MNIIAISGLAGSGKDTVAGYLLENEGFVSIAFADPLKRFASEIWGFTNTQLWGPSENRSLPDKRYKTENSEFLTPRKVLQYIGNDCVRTLDKDVWIRYGINIAKRLLTEQGLCYSQIEGLQSYWKQTCQGEFDRIEGYPKNIKAVIITDCRYVNELNAIKENGGKLIRIKKPGAGLKGVFGKHQSESEMSELSENIFDYIINNIGTLEDLKKRVNEIVDDMYS